MPKTFDPYHRWLGIRPEEQPADHYRLLGLARFEDDIEVIRDAAERQIRHVRTYELGQHAKLTQKILNELARAKSCLLDAKKRAAYVETLKPEQDSRAMSAAISTSPFPEEPKTYSPIEPTRRGGRRSPVKRSLFTAARKVDDVLWTLSGRDQAIIHNLLWCVLAMAATVGLGIMGAMMLPGLDDPELLPLPSKPE